MTSGFLRTPLFARLRRLAGSVCLAAMVAQAALSGLHVLHDSDNLPLAFAAEDASSSLSAEAPREHHGTRHDPAACPACRTASEWKSLLPSASANALPATRALEDWPPADAGLPDQSQPGGWSARAPPSLA